MKIKGFGGVFWRTKDVVSLKNWYQETLKISMDDWNGTIIKPDEGNEGQGSAETRAPSPKKVPPGTTKRSRDK